MKEYLGDSVYAELAGGVVILTTHTARIPRRPNIIITAHPPKKPEKTA